MTLQVPRYYSFQEVPFVVESSVSAEAFNFSIILLLLSLHNNCHSDKTKMTVWNFQTLDLNFELFVPLYYQYTSENWQIPTFSLEKYITKFYMHIVGIHRLPESFHYSP